MNSPELERLLSEEQVRARWESASAADPKLVEEGWAARFVTDRQRADEVVGLYRRLGFEVRLEPLRLRDLPEGCSDCRLMLLFQFSLVYTRRPVEE